MTLSRLIPLGTAAFLLAFAAFSGPSPLSAQETAQTAALSPEEARAARSEAMKAVGGANRALAPLVAGEPLAPAVVGEAAKTIHEQALKVASLFPRGSSSDELAGSFSLPTVWSQPEGFETARANLEKAALRLQQAAASGDSIAINAAFAELRPTCGACHQTYRKPKD